MGETAEERARRLALRSGEPGRWYWSDEIMAEICDPSTYYFRQPKVSLVKKYNKNSFKFV